MIKRYYSYRKKLLLPSICIIAILFSVLLLLDAPLANAQVERVPFIIGSGGFSFTDGMYYEAEFRLPYGIAFDENKNVLFIADLQNHRIRQLDFKTYKVTTIAGESTRIDRFGFPAGGHRDGDAKQAMFNRPRGIAVAPNGALYIADTGNHMIRVYYEGKVFTVAGNGTPGYRDGKGTQAIFNNPSAIAIGPDGNLYVSDTLNQVIRMIDQEGNVTTYAGKPKDTSLLFEPAGVAFSPDGILYIADSANHQIKRVVNGKIESVSGSDTEPDTDTKYRIGGNEDGIGKDAKFNFPRGITFGENGLLFVTDSLNHTIRAITPAGKVYTIAGTGVSGKNWDERAIVHFDGPFGIYYARNTLFVSDSWNNRIIAMPTTPEYLRSVIDFTKKLSKLPVYIDGVELFFPDVQPFIEDGNPKVPIRFIAEAMGADVSWDSANRMVVVKRKGYMIMLKESEGDFFVKDGRSMVGLRVITEKLGYFVEWNADEMAVIIETFGN